MENQEILHRFVKGWKFDTDDHQEDSMTFIKGLNGRLFSFNGSTSYTSLQGTKKLLEVKSLLKILGYSSFSDELILFTKCDKESFDNEDYNTWNLYTDEDIDTVFIENRYCSDVEEVEFDLSEIYTLRNSVPNFSQCSIGNIEESDLDAYDVIWSIKKLNNQYQIKPLWRGDMGWRFSDKIDTENVYENENKKHVYFTNFRGRFKVINVKDPNLKNSSEEELNAFQSNMILSPIISSVEEGGNVASGSVFFAYRLVTVNGQVTDFSQLSESVPILKNTINGNRVEGGSMGDSTTKKVNAKIVIPDYEKYSDVEIIAIHYLEKHSPVIKDIGIFPVSPVVKFTYFGGESDIDTNVTFSDVISRSSNWKYCSTTRSVNNTLYAGGLRNVPINHIRQQLVTDFALKSWDLKGDTFNCAMNPKPWDYRVIPTEIGSDKMYSVSKRLYTSIRVFGSFNIKLVNKLTGDFNEINIGSDSLSYIDQTELIYQWLLGLDLSMYPNLKISKTSPGFLFERLTPSIENDISQYVLETDNEETIIDYQEEIKYDTQSIGISIGSWEYGAVSLGYNQGNGIKITFEELEETVLRKNNSVYEGDGRILKMELPSSKKGFKKGEIYRLGIECQLNDGSDMFVIPLGDIKVPSHGDGKPMGGNYLNSREVDDVLKSNKIIISASVRFGCDYKKIIKSFRLMYVERTEENRTILCQGISAPLERVLPFSWEHEYNPPEKVSEKWMLPFYGGPTYDGFGLKRYDDNSESSNGDGFSGQAHQKRVVTNRSIFFFDSPDINYHILSDDAISNATLEVLSILNTDSPRNENPFTLGLLRTNPGGGSRQVGVTLRNILPWFSNIAHRDYLIGEQHRPSHVNFAVFSKETPYRKSHEVDFSYKMTPGEVIPGIDFNTSFDISNNAMTLEFQYWFHSTRGRIGEYFGPNKFFGSRNIATGTNTVIVKSRDDLFTDQFVNGSIGPITYYSYMQTDLDNNNNTQFQGFDSYALIDIYLNNKESVYGGRTEYAYSKNVYIPLSETIPVHQDSNSEQVFSVYGDTYTTLYVKNKTDSRDAERLTETIQLKGEANKWGEDVWRRHGSFVYAFIVESDIEPKYTHERRNYRETEFDFSFPENEVVNEAYFQKRSLRSSIPSPLRFKENPEMLNIISSSDVKMSGDFYDAWSSFRVNNFYELERGKGVVYNLVRYLDTLFAIQEKGTSQLLIDPSAFVQTNQGEVSLRQGTGGNVANHKIISDYGTTIRNAVKSISNSEKEIFGFFFYDNTRNEFVKIDEGLFFKNELSLFIKNLFKNNPVVDSYAFYDNKHKELNIYVKPEIGEGFVISYSEAFQAFNGIFKYDNSIFINWDEGILAPKKNHGNTSLDIHGLNEGSPLVFFDEGHNMELEFVVNESATIVKIFKHLSGNISMMKHIDEIKLTTSLGQERIIYSDHHKYKIREGFHSVPLKNRFDWEDLRGDYMTVNIKISHEDLKDLVRIHDIIIYVRNSYQ